MFLSLYFWFHVHSIVTTHFPSNIYADICCKVRMISNYQLSCRVPGVRVFVYVCVCKRARAVSCVVSLHSAISRMSQTHRAQCLTAKLTHLYSCPHRLSCAHTHMHTRSHISEYFIFGIATYI